MFRDIVGNHTCWSLGRGRRLGSAWPSRFGGRCAASLAHPFKTALPNRGCGGGQTHARLCRRCSGGLAVRTGWCCGLVWLSLAPFSCHPSAASRLSRLAPEVIPVWAMTLSACDGLHGGGRINRGGVDLGPSEILCQRKRETAWELAGSLGLGVQPSKVPRSKIQGLASQVQVVVEIVSAPWAARTVAYCAVLQTRVLLGIEWRPRPSSSNRLHPSTFARLSAHMGLHRPHRLVAAFLSLQQRPSSQSACPASQPASQPVP